MTDAARPGSVLVVGGGVAGFAAVRELRRRGFEGELTLVDPEGLPYDRPPLSKEFLTGDADAHRLLLAPPAWFAEHRVALVARRVERLELDDDARPRAVLDDGAVLTADAVVLAPGGRPRPLAVPGGDHLDVAVLRTRADAERLAARLHVGARVTVIGGGFTGAEVASAARAALAEVTLVSASAAPALAAVGPALAARLHGMHAAHGVDVLEGAVTGIDHADAADSAADVPHTVHVRRPDGSETSVTADLVVAAVGIVPDTALAEAAGLAVDGGILVDAAGRTSHPAVFAAGDAVRRRRTDTVPAHAARHWEPALHSGQDVAAAILGEDVSDRGAPWFWSDRHGVHVEGVGLMLPVPGGRIVDRSVRGTVVASFALDAAGRMTGAASVDDPMAVKAARRIIDRGIVVDPDRLADPDVPVKALLRG
ncbi:nitrite reductase [Micrococcus flavus]|uniref:3-phenylpropionate/trans-cinnamate dioxygenase ferredoxin reductase subunit n=1 Tax=Micrococcus flavus TaxID=384602 RepID=A0A4Y8X1W0_9MICC|nr:FAD-dependent oxidoreductase [Micrococcus flavus]MBB4881863.1 3-phenylpropionate/trans-cinnamate dioxygenase ferredoxin reductase subunit [Micrococcus flavus]TFI03591.1 nitrite reductase [Micrococcus flavus]GGK45496.1 hypothetical rubredoxin/ferredoxin reductase [Micrococcus flavus]